MDILRFIGHILLATWLGIFLGAEVFLSGLAALLHPGLIALYLLMFLIADEIQSRWHLSQKYIFGLGMLFEIWLGALIGQEVYQPGLNFPLGLAGINLVSLILISSAWGMFLVTWMHLVQRISPRPAQLRYLRMRRLAIAAALIFLGLFYVSNQFRPARAAADIFLVILGTLGLAAWFLWARNSHKQGNPPQFSRGILALSVAFIFLSLLSLFFPLNPPFHIYWTYFLWMPLFIYFASRKRLRL